MPWIIFRVPSILANVILIYFFTLIIFAILLSLVIINALRHKQNSDSIKIALIIASVISISPIGYAFSFLWVIIAWLILIIKIIKIIQAIIHEESFKYNVISAASILFFYLVVILSGINGLEPIMP